MIREMLTEAVAMVGATLAAVVLAAVAYSGLLLLN